MVTASTDIAAFLRLLHRPGDVFEIRAPKCPDRPGGAYRATASGYFDDPDKAAIEAAKLDGLGPPGIYVTLNPCKPALLARAANRIETRAQATTSDADILCRRWLVLDIDPVRPAGVSATDGEMGAALSLADKVRDHLHYVRGWPEPVLCASGNGAYLLYRAELPNDDGATETVKRMLQALAHQFDGADAKIDTSTFNASRIIKVMGTTARKGDNLQ